MNNSKCPRVAKDELFEKILWWSKYRNTLTGIWDTLKATKYFDGQEIEFTIIRDKRLPIQEEVSKASNVISTLTKEFEEIATP